MYKKVIFTFMKFCIYIFFFIKTGQILEETCLGQLTYRNCAKRKTAQFICCKVVYALFQERSHTAVNLRAVTAPLPSCPISSTTCATTKTRWRKKLHVSTSVWSVTDPTPMKAVLRLTPSRSVSELSAVLLWQPGEIQRSLLLVL